MQIKLARIYADISRSVYGSKGRLRKKFVISIKSVLDDMAVIAEELRNSFPLHADERFGGISRMPAHLHLMYYQKILNILESLQDQDLLESFLPWDLDSLFVSTMVLVLIRFVDDTLSENSSVWLNKAFGFLDIMAANGNRIAEFRCAELRKVEEMLSEYLASRTPQQFAPLIIQQGAQQPQPPPPPAGFCFPPPPDNQSPRNIMSSTDAMGMYTAFSDESSGFGDDLTAEQILAVAESMDLGSTDWFSSFATMDTYQMVDQQHPI
ncbi:hypothetical protein N0V90_001806 [Kalmusia sp. IMI 367209]|nr:hypothetical protein N0V90_001806 [Kalmusia sp. IMI 367209]